MSPDRDGTEFEEGFIHLPAGARLGDWRVLRVLGQGRFGRVYEATYERPDGTKAAQRMPGRAALKVFQDTLVLSPVARAELTREAEAMASISHPNVLGFYGDITLSKRSDYPGTRFFVLELGDNDLLEESSRTEAGLPAADVLDIAVDIAAGLKAVHTKYLHGDVKPANIIRVDRLYKLGDMGVAARLEGTGAYPKPGTMCYRPPEYGRRMGTRSQTKWKERVGQPYDIWGLGITLHEILTKRHPFEPPGEHLDGLQIFERVQSGRAPVIEVDDPTLRTVIERCLDVDVERRATAEELLAILGRPPDFVSRTPARPRRPDPKAIRNILPPLSATLHGRAGLLQEMRLGLQRQAVVSLLGVEGVGKTQLAATYASRHGEDYDVVWWVRAGRPETLRADYAALAQRLGLAGGAVEEAPTIEALRRWLDGPRRWLVVLDDATPDLWPSVVAARGKGHVLVTSTSSPAERARSIGVDRLKRDDAVAWVLTRTGESDGASADRLAEALGDLPLALEIATAFVEVQGTLAGYLDRLRRRVPELFSASRSTDCHPVAATCTVTFEHLQRTSRGAWDLLRLCAFLAPEDIPLGRLAGGAATLPKGLQRAVRAPDGPVAVLRRFAVLERSGDALFVHRLVQDAVREALGPEGRREWSGIAVRTLESSCAADDAPDRRLLPHLLAAVERPEAPAAEPRATSALLERVAAYLRTAGAPAEARKHLERALDILESEEGPDEGQVSIQLVGLGSLLLELGDDAGARRCLERSLAIAESAVGLDDPRVGDRMWSLGLALRKVGDAAGAGRCFERAVAIAEADHGADHPEVGIRLDDLGLALLDLGDHRAAQECFERSLQIAESAYGPDHPDAGVRLHHLGLARHELGDDRAAIQCLERSLAIAQDAHGPDHPEIGRRLNDLGLARLGLGDYARARQDLEAAVAVAEKAQGPDDPEVGARRNNLGMALRGLGDSAGARRHLEAAVAIAETAHGPHDADVGIRLNNLGLVLLDLGEDETARHAFERSLTIAQAVHGPAHAEVGTRRSNLVLALLNLGEHAEARRQLETATAIADVAPPADPVLPPVEDHEADVATAPGEHELEDPDLTSGAPTPSTDPAPGGSTREGSGRRIAAVLVALVTLLSATVALAMRTSLAVAEGSIVILAIDVSLSMEAADVAPSRIEVAKAAASRFVDRMPSGTRMGLVSFSGISSLRVPLTTDPAQMKEGISSMELAPRTAVGEAIFTALQGITSFARPGGHEPAARIVLVSDGETTVGRPDEDAARAASEAKVPVSTIALGTEQGSVRVQGRDVLVPVNKAALERIAAATDGRAYEAASAAELDRVYDDVRRSMAHRNERDGVTARGLALATVLATSAGALVWFAGRRRAPDRVR